MQIKIPIIPLHKASSPEETALDEAGFNFVQKCIDVLESRGN
jgi:hypothetical protein